MKRTIKFLKIIAIALTIIIAIMFIKFRPAYSVSLNGEMIGYVGDEKEFKEKINENVLDSEEDEAMWLCPTVYFGPEPNETGNYCIAAHNYDKENMFNHIIELKAGDKLTLEDNKNGVKIYEIYDIYKVKPTDTEVLSQKTNGRTELTLITCSDYSSTRIIVKAFAK